MKNLCDSSFYNKTILFLKKATFTASGLVHLYKFYEKMDKRELGNILLAVLRYFWKDKYFDLCVRETKTKMYRLKEKILFFLDVDENSFIKHHIIPKLYTYVCVCIKYKEKRGFDLYKICMLWFYKYIYKNVWTLNTKCTQVKKLNFVRKFICIVEER